MYIDTSKFLRSASTLFTAAGESATNFSARSGLVASRWVLILMMWIEWYCLLLVISVLTHTKLSLGYTNDSYNRRTKVKPKHGLPPRWPSGRSSLWMTSAAQKGSSSITAMLWLHFCPREESHTNSLFSPPLVYIWTSIKLRTETYALT